MPAPSVAAGAHLVGSVPLRSTEEVLRSVSESLGSCLRRLPDGETGPRSDWIVWQYPVLSSRPEFEVCPPGPDHYRALPRLRLRAGAAASDVQLDNLGYAQAAIASHRTFAALKRDGVIPRHCRFQVSLPTPLAPISAFVAPDDQAALEPVYEQAMLRELARITDAVPPEQLAVQWDANFEFGMLEGTVPVWFADVRAGIVERLLRLARHVPAGVELGYHLCYGDHGHRLFGEPADLGNLVSVANSLSTSLGRPLNWLHLPVPPDADQAFFEPLRDLVRRSETELYLGLVHQGDGREGARARIDMAAAALVERFGVATECGWGRHSPAGIPALIGLHAAVTEPIAEPDGPPPLFSWPPGFSRVLDEDWTTQPLEGSGLQYDSVADHDWYSNLDPTVDELAGALTEGDILLDYSGGTGILLDRLQLRLFHAPVGVVIVDSSPKFLRVALEKFRDDSRVALRLLRWSKEERRLERLEEVLGPALTDRGVDAIASTNAVHLYPDLDATVDAWAKVLRPGGRLFVNSGNIRNPRARATEWILDETVWVIDDMAQGLVRTDPGYADYRAALDDGERMKAHGAYRDRVFLEPRPLDFYLDAFSTGGLTVESVREKTVSASVDHWFEFLSAYHDAVLGWVGGTQKVDGRPPTPEAVADRLRLLRHSMEILFGGRPKFSACWTYITCRR